MKKIKLTQGKYALVDNTDFEWLNQWKWCFSACGYKTGKGYAVRYSRNNEKRETIYMHRLIAQPPLGLITDHINHNGLDNRRNNLQIVDKNKNDKLKSKHYDGKCKYKGVYETRFGNYVSMITSNKTKYHLGTFDTPLKARRAYLRAARELHGLTAI